MSSKLNDELAKVCKDLILEDPFYGSFLMMLDKQFSEKVPTAGVSIQGIAYKLYMNEEFWKSLSLDHRKGLLKHELLHIALFHLTEFKDLNLRNKDIANIAMDLEINQYIKKDLLPEGGQTLDLYPELNLKEKAGTHYYFDELTKASQNPGTCPNLDKMLEASNQGLSICVVEGDGSGQEIEVQVPDHSTWNDSDNIDEATKKLIDNHLKNILNEVADQIKKSRGTVPGEIAGILDKINIEEPPKFDWRGYLRRYAGGSVKTYTKKTRRKYNKRFEENPGLKIKQKKHILVALDTSGSVSNEELKEFMQEIHHIYKTGSDVTVAHADAAIQKIHPYNPKDEYKIYGRGGTSFDPVVDYYVENKRKYTCLIYLTDGEAPAPDARVNKVLWVLSSKSNMTDHLPGQTIKLN
jgi:predicted metal-dependent peptidase